MIISIAFSEGMYKSYANQFRTVIPDADRVINRLIEAGHQINITYVLSEDWMFCYHWFNDNIRSGHKPTINGDFGDCIIHPKAIGSPTICPITGPRYINWPKVEEMLEKIKVLGKNENPPKLVGEYEGDPHG